MLRLVVEFVTFVLATYGFFCLVISILDHMRSKAGTRGQMQLVLLVRNAEDVIEGILRDFELAYASKRMIPGKSLLVVDMGSTDGTADIVKRLSEEFGPLELVRCQERNRMFDAFTDVME